MIDIIYRYDPQDQRPRPLPRTPVEARKRLEEGNRLFSELLLAEDQGKSHDPRIIEYDFRALGLGEAAGHAPEQAPFAAFLGCADARVPIELIFSQGCNDLFVVRVAGNVLGSECLGSLDFAIDRMKSLKLLVVLGHSQCGAVTAAVDTFLDPAFYLSIAGHQALRILVDRLMVAVRGAAHGLDAVWDRGIVKHPNYRTALIEAGVVYNAALGAFTLLREAREKKAKGFDAVFGVYDLVHRRVGVPSSRAIDTDGWDWQLMSPPKTEKHFAKLAEDVAQSPLIASLLATKRHTKRN